MLSHLFLDYLTTRGIPPLFPLDYARWSAEVFFYTEGVMTVVSLTIIILFYKKPALRKKSVGLLLIFLIIFAAIGAIRIDGKDGDERSMRELILKGSDSDLTDPNPRELRIMTYPKHDLFQCFAVYQEGGRTNIQKYNILTGMGENNASYLDLNVTSLGKDLDKALQAADKLPQVEIFRWRSHAVAINASYGNDSWDLQYYDPVTRMELNSTHFSWRADSSRHGPMDVKVEDSGKDGQPPKSFLVDPLTRL